MDQDATLLRPSLICERKRKLQSAESLPRTIQQIYIIFEVFRLLEIRFLLINIFLYYIFKEIFVVINVILALRSNPVDGK